MPYMRKSYFLIKQKQVLMHECEGQNKDKKYYIYIKR